MTGGDAGLSAINGQLAVAAQAPALPWAWITAGGGGNRGLAPSFQVRRLAPDILLFANLGAVQFNYGYGLDQCRRAVDMIQADALVLHLNALQEAVQPEGDAILPGFWSRIGRPVRAAAAGAGDRQRSGLGHRQAAATRRRRPGVGAIDVAGAGGTRGRRWKAPGQTESQKRGR